MPATYRGRRGGSVGCQAQRRRPNVLLDIFTEDAIWHAWSSSALASAAESGPLFINPIVYTEVSVRFSRVEDLDEALRPEDFRRAPLPCAAAFLAGKAFMVYRRTRGSVSRPLPDFFIGAHAAVEGFMPILGLCAWFPTTEAGEFNYGPDGARVPSCARSTSGQ